MNHPMHIASNGRRIRWQLAALALLAGGVLFSSSLEVFAQQPPAQPAQSEAGPRGYMGPDGARRESMLKRTLGRIGASKEQQEKIAGIMKQAHDELRPLREQRLAARKTMVGLLTQPTLDRAAIEAQRKEQIRLADTSSTRLTKAIADAAEVLTPEQRVEFAKRMPQFRHHGARHHGRG